MANSEEDAAGVPHRLAAECPILTQLVTEMAAQDVLNSCRLTGQA
jgi:hypothetical protein